MQINDKLINAVKQVDLKINMEIFQTLKPHPWNFRILYLANLSFISNY